LCVGMIISLRLWFSTKMEKKEASRIRLIFLTIIFWTVGELIYVYQQAFLGIAVPYPSVADIFYLSSTVFLCFHLYNVLRLKRHTLKANKLLYLGFLSSAFPTYFFLDGVYNYEEYYSDANLEFLVSSAYYLSDAVLIFPCIPIILSMRRKDPFVFHWLLVTMAVMVIVSADIGYIFIASVSDELIQDTGWLWAFVYSIAYILLTASVIWFDRIKTILDYKKYSETLKVRLENESAGNTSDDRPVETFEDDSQLLATLSQLLRNAEDSIDMLFVRYFIKQEIFVRIINILYEITRKNKLLNIRILLPSSESRNKILSNNNQRIVIKYFDRRLSSNTATIILDGDSIHEFGSRSENTSNPTYFVQNITNESRKQLHWTLFETIWLIEKPAEYG
jgi:hypothetical protein